MTLMGRISRFVVAHRVAVAVGWLALTVAGVATAQTTTSRLSTEFSLPGREGAETAAQLAALYRISPVDSVLVPVVQLPAGVTVDSPGVREALGRFDAAIANAGGNLPDGEPAVKIVSYASTGDRHFVSADGRTVFAIVTLPPPHSAQAFEAPPQEVAIRHLVDGARVAGGHAWLTGLDELVTSGQGNEGPSLLVETLLGGAGALLVLAFVFASFIAFVPLVIAVVAIETTFFVLLGITLLTDVSFIVQFLVALIGLGVAIDYSLLVVTRWREERAQGRSNDEAIHRAMETAGKAVVFSGTTVAVGLLSLVVLPVPFLRSVGFGGLLIPLISVLVAVTLLPVILHSIGDPSVRWPWQYPPSVRSVVTFPARLLRRLATFPAVRTEARPSRGWVAWARAVVRHRAVAAAAGTVAIAALALPTLHIRVGTPVPEALAQAGPARQGLDALDASGLGTVAFEPYFLLVEGKDPQAVAQAARRVAGMTTALVPSGPAWRSPVAPGTAVVVALSSLDPASSAGRAQIDDLRRAVAAVPGPGTVRLTGDRVVSAEFTSAVYDSFPLMLGLVVLVTYVLLARAFRSLLLPLKAVVLNLVSLAAAYGILVLVWQDGHGSQQIFGVQASGAIVVWIPLMVFAFLYGLSMDYEVFLLARIREEYDECGSTDLAIVRGMGRTGRLVTSAAFILFLAFLALGSAPSAIVKTFATGLGAGILIDATIIRMLLVPALVSLFGRWNWWLPHLPARVLGTRPSPARREVGRRLPQEV